jgi:hypothetical protein
MKKKTRIVELVISDDSQELTIDAISLVSSPAIEEDFVFFGKEKNNLTFAKVDEEKRMLISPALIPNKQIFRYDPQTDSDYYVYFSKETVAQAAALYLKHNNHHKATYEHSDRVSGVLTVESWIKEGEQDKSNLYGFKGLPLGTWFVKMKIENDELWDKIKSGEVKGLSIEGYFIDRMETMSKKEFTNEEVRTALKELLSVQKVELGIADDIKKIEHEIYSVDEKLLIKDILAPLRKAIVKFEGVAKLESKLSTEIKKAKAALKDLGISEKNIPWVERAERSLDLTQELGESAANLSKIEKML